MKLPFAKTVICLLLIISSNVSISQDRETVEPVADFNANFCNFPHAWTVSKGENVSIGIVGSDEKRLELSIRQLNFLAPKAQINALSKSAFLSQDKTPAQDIIVVLESFSEQQYQAMLTSISSLTKEGKLVIMPACFDGIEKGKDYSRWKEIVRSASEHGAIIVGAFGRAYQIGGLDFWQDLPIDVFALHNRIDGDKYFNPDVTIDKSFDSPVNIAAATSALLMSKHGNLKPGEVRGIFRQNGREVFWYHLRIFFNKEKPWSSVRPFLSEESARNFLEQRKQFKSEIVSTYRGKCLDAALVLGIQPPSSGQWTMDVLNVAEAQQSATGKGITVAILDHLFDKNDISLKRRTVKPGSVIPDLPAFDQDNTAGHGTSMAQELLKVAPDVTIMPVRITGPGYWGHTEYYAKGIDYAVENGADIISLSHRAVSKEHLVALDEAIEKASANGIIFVYIHYNGQKEEPIVPGPIEFAQYDNSGERKIYVIGTNFIDEMMFPYTWGLSQTAPIVSGVIAMMKELNPDLKPAEIKKILSESGRSIEGGYQMLDAAQALKLVKKGIDE